MQEPTGIGPVGPTAEVGTRHDEGDSGSERRCPAGVREASRKCERPPLRVPLGFTPNRKRLTKKRTERASSGPAHRQAHLIR